MYVFKTSAAEDSLLFVAVHCHNVAAAIMSACFLVASLFCTHVCFHALADFKSIPD